MVYTSLKARTGCKTKCVLQEATIRGPSLCLREVYHTSVYTIKAGDSRNQPMKTSEEAETQESVSKHSDLFSARRG